MFLRAVIQHNVSLAVHLILRPNINKRISSVKGAVELCLQDIAKQTLPVKCYTQAHTHAQWSESANQSLVCVL